MNLHLENKLALVTASSGGIGRAIAQSLAGEGARVIINGLSEKSVNTAISSIREVHPEAWLEPLVADSSQFAGAETMLASGINGAAFRVDGGIVRSVF